MSKMKRIVNLIGLISFVSCNLQAQTNKDKETINITQLKAYEKDSKIFIDWATDGNTICNYWEVQSSPNGTQFSTIALVLGPDPKHPGDRYQYRNNINEIKGTTAYFRLRHISADGQEQISKIVQPAK